MFARILFIASAIAPSLGRELLAPFAAAGVVCAVFAYFQTHETRRDSKTAADFHLGPPTDLRLAIQFALLLGGFALAVHYTRELLSDEWVIALAAISGFVDVDATTVTMARGVDGHGESIPMRLAASAVLVATAVNMLSKAFITRAIGGHDLFVRTMTMTASAAGAAVIVAGVGLYL
jgi:uncharacterized membrane protein (DUF4010 family)